MKKIIGTPKTTNDKLIKQIGKTNVNYFYLKNKKDFRDQILVSIQQNDDVLDIGMSMRDKYSKIKSNSLETLDVNDYNEYPDIICDICDNIDGLENKYDKIICIAVLEHVYNPFKAVENLNIMLKEKGTLFGFVPYLYQYHAPMDLKFQDYFRFSKDAVSFLFKDFNHLEIFPVRGRISAPLSVLFGAKWKQYIEKTKINLLLDKFVSDEKNLKQCSGFYFTAKK
tara:strand:- start:403 stop:1077 length:675 start_codon:yes stop_codon:yes gene_type:complete